MYIVDDMPVEVPGEGNVNVWSDPIDATALAEHDHWAASIGRRIELCVVTARQCATGARESGTEMAPELGRERRTLRLKAFE